MQLKPWQSAVLLIGGAAILIYSARSSAGPLWRPVNWSRDRILLIGDSLAVGLKPKFESLRDTVPGFAFGTVAKQGAKISAFNSNDGETGGGLAQALVDFKPTVVLISLGTNDEVARKNNPNADVSAATQAEVDKLLAKFPDAHVIWIGPPMFAPNKWPMDDGFRQMLANKVGPINYFDTAAYPIARAGDGIHMTGAGYADWATRIVEWINAQNAAN